MDKQHNFKLIDGEFSPQDAKSILYTLVSSKINFHSRESFGIQVRSSGDTSWHENRIKELAQTNADIRQLMEYAAEKKFRLKINSTIEIELINETI